MKLPPDQRRKFVEHGRTGGRARAAALDPERRRAIARRAARARWIRERFGASSFEELGLPGGELIDTGLADLADGRPSVASYLVSIAWPRLRREGVPVSKPLVDPEDGLYELLSKTEGDLAFARYQAFLQQASSFADACRIVRVDRA